MIDWSKAESIAGRELARQARKAEQAREVAKERRFREFVESLIDADIKKLEKGESL